ncbi:hypothetical protein [Methylocella sp.]|uniref:hypothetical protein n=1 Tax=Methylocella sp. TaxID=1978226 RepID=UPI00378388E3
MSQQPAVYERTFIRETSDGRKIEVIGPYVCVDGDPVADGMVEVKTHPNKDAILHALPNAAFMAGPIVLVAEEASLVRGAFAKFKQPEQNLAQIEKRFREAYNARARLEGIE